MRCLEFIKKRKRDFLILSVLLLAALACAVPPLVRRASRAEAAQDGEGAGSGASSRDADSRSGADAASGRAQPGSGGNPGGAGLFVVVEGSYGEILRVPLSIDARYLVKDGVAEQVAADFTLSDLGEEGSPSRHDINILEIKDREARCIESNCANQVCVHSLPLTELSYDIPIVCLPHGLAVVIEEA